MNKNKKKNQKRVMNGTNTVTIVKDHELTLAEVLLTIERGERIAKKMVKAMCSGTPSSGNPVADIASGMFALALTKHMYTEQARKEGVEVEVMFDEIEQWLRNDK